MARVLILREAGAARETARQLRTLGHKPLLCPSEVVIRLESELPTAPLDGFVVTSAQAVPRLAEAFAADARPVFAVGEATAAALRSAGFANVHAGSGMSSSLPRVIRDVFGASSGDVRLLYAAGRNRSGSLEEAVAKASVHLSIWEVYDVVTRVPSEPELRRCLGGERADAVLILSQAQAQAFGDQIAAYLGGDIERPRLLCLSGRIAEALPPSLRPHAEISARPRLASLFERL